MIITPKMQDTVDQELGNPFLLAYPGPLRLPGRGLHRDDDLGQEFRFPLGKGESQDIGGSFPPEIAEIQLRDIRIVGKNEGKFPAAAGGPFRKARGGEDRPGQISYLPWVYCRSFPRDPDRYSHPSPWEQAPLSPPVRDSQRAGGKSPLKPG